MEGILKNLSQFVWCFIYIDWVNNGFQWAIFLFRNILKLVSGEKKLDFMVCVTKLSIVFIFVVEAGQTYK